MKLYKVGLYTYCTMMNHISHFVKANHLYIQLYIYNYIYIYINIYVDGFNSHVSDYHLSDQHEAFRKFFTKPSANKALGLNRFSV